MSEPARVAGEPAPVATLLRCRGLTKAYGSGAARVAVLNGVDLDVGAGDMVAILGESGAGKTTFLHLVGALDRPDAGRIEVRGREIGGAAAAARASYRNRDLGFVFQFHHLLPEFSAVENVMMPLLIGGEPQASSRQRASDLLGELGLAAALDRRPAELSGGEQQRVAIARAVVRRPLLLLADEPTGNLDERNAAAAFAVLRDLHRSRGMTTILVTHSERLAAQCDHVLVMERGSLTPRSGGR